MPAPDWFKKRNGKCTVHGCDLVEQTKFKNKKSGLVYCPKCREEAIKQENEQRRVEAENSNHPEV